MIVIIHHVHYRRPPSSVGSILLCKKALSRAAYMAVCVGVSGGKCPADSFEWLTNLLACTQLLSAIIANKESREREVSGVMDVGTSNNHNDRHHLLNRGMLRSVELLFLFSIDLSKEVLLALMMMMMVTVCKQDRRNWKSSIVWLCKLCDGGDRRVSGGIVFLYRHLRREKLTPCGGVSFELLSGGHAVIGHWPVWECYAFRNIGSGSVSCWI